MASLKTELQNYRREIGLLQSAPCSEEENAAYIKLHNECLPLPDGVYRDEYGFGAYTEKFSRIPDNDLTADDIRKYLMYKHLAHLNSIKNAIIFFIVLFAIAAVITIFTVLSLFR